MLLTSSYLYKYERIRVGMRKSSLHLLMCIIVLKYVEIICSII